MKIGNDKALHYELGVLLFNLVSNHTDSIIINNNYDSTGNFVNLIEAIGFRDLHLLENGFLAECQNYNIDEEKGLDLFNNALEIVSNY